MCMEEFRWLAAAIAAQPHRTLVGRTRLQKTMYLLQRSGFPTAYNYSLHFYGPYSEELVSDIELLKTLNLVTEEEVYSDRTYYRYNARNEVNSSPASGFNTQIGVLAQADATVLELAATYDSFRELGYDHAESMRRLRLKKGEVKCTPENLCAALKLLKELGLPNAA